MTIEIKCPTCRATNQLSGNQLLCRRCSLDLSSVYNVKVWSYLHRYKAISNLLTGNINQAHEDVKKALELSKAS